MRSPARLLTKHRNLLLLTLLTGTLLLCAHGDRATPAASVSIPVAETAAMPLSPLESCRQQRDAEALRDMSALEALIGQPQLDEATREAAAARLQEIVDARQAQSALESALCSSSLSPCVAVVSGGSLTLVTSKKTVTEQDSALLLTLAAAHTGIPPEKVRVITAN